MMRILVINTWYYPNLQGGAEHSVKILAENLQKNNTVGVFCIDNKNNGLKKELINEVTIYRSDGGKYDLYGAYFSERSITKKLYDKYHEIFNTSIKQHLMDVIKEFKPDIVHCNCLSGISVKLFPLLKKLNIPTVLTLRNYFLIYPFDKDMIPVKFLNAIFQNIYFQLCRKYTDSIQAITAPSEFTLNVHLAKKFFEKAIIKQCIPNSIQVERKKIQNSIQNKLRRKEEFTRFLYVGWITEPKGIQRLISAFEQLVCDNISLTLCGSGNLEVYVKNKALEDKRIHFLGKLSPKALAEEYEKADILVVPSIWEEPFGRVIIEGNQHGLPVICSDRGGIPEIIRQMKSGLIYHSESTEQLVEAMKYMMQKDKLVVFYENILKNIEYYSVMNQIDMFCNLYEKLI